MNILQSDIKLIPSCNERNLQPPDTEDRRGEICKLETLLVKQTCKRSLMMFGKLSAKISLPGAFQYLCLANHPFKCQNHSSGFLQIVATSSEECTFIVKGNIAKMSE